MFCPILIHSHVTHFHIENFLPKFRNFAAINFNSINLLIGIKTNTHLNFPFLHVMTSLLLHLSLFLKQRRLIIVITIMFLPIKIRSVMMRILIPLLMTLPLPLLFIITLINFQYSKLLLFLHLPLLLNTLINSSKFCNSCNQKKEFDFALTYDTRLFVFQNSAFQFPIQFCSFRAGSSYLQMKKYCYMYATLSYFFPN